MAVFPPRWAPTQSEMQMADDQMTNAVTLDLRAWIPYRCSVVTNRVSALLEKMYGEKYGLSVNGWRIMAQLGQMEPLSAKQVAEGTAMDQVRVTRALSDLASAGMLSRRTDSQDRRRVVLRLSRKGRQAYEEIVPLAIGIERALLSEMSEAERQVLKTLTDKMMIQVEKILNEDANWLDFVSETEPANPN